MDIYKDVLTESIEVDGVDKRDYPDMADSYCSYAEFKDGTPLTDEQLGIFTDTYSETIQEIARNKVF